MKVRFSNVLSVVIIIVVTLFVGWQYFSFWGHRYSWAHAHDIYDNQTHLYIMMDGEANAEEYPYMYAYKKGVFMVVDNSLFTSKGIKVYLEEDNKETALLTFINDKFYDGQMHITRDVNDLSDRETMFYHRLKNGLSF